MEALCFLPHSVKQITISGMAYGEELNISLLPIGIRKLKLQNLKCNLNLLPQNIEELSMMFVETEFVSKFPPKLRKIKMQSNLLENIEIPEGIQIKIYYKNNERRILLLRPQTRWMFTQYAQN